MNTKLICIVGQKRSGKDEFANIFKQTVGCENITEYALANPIKDVLDSQYEKTEMHRHSGVILTRSNWDGFCEQDVNISNELWHFDREAPLMISNANASTLILKAIIDLQCNTNSLKGKYSEDEIKRLIMENDQFWSLRKLMQVFGTDIVVNMIDKQYWNRLFLDKFVDCETNYFLLKDIRQGHEIDLMRKLGATIIHVVRDNQSKSDDHITEKKVEIKPGELVVYNDGSLSEYHEKIEILIKEIQND